MRGPSAGWETSLTVVEYDTASRTYAFWKLEIIDSGDQLIDELGVYDATLLNPSQSTIAIGAFGNGLYVNATGNNSGAEMVSDSELRSFGQKITISVWIKSKSQSSLSVASALSRDYSDHFAILINQSQVTNQDWTIGNSTNNITKSLVAETPHNIIISIDYNKNQMYIWVDGVREALLDWDGTDSSRPLVIGCNTEATIQLGTNYFKGVIDELKIYRGIGTDAEAKATYDGFYNKSAENQIPSRGEIFTSSVSSPTLTISINKTLTGSSASGEASIYGFDNYGNPDPVNTDGFIYVDGLKINIPRHYFSPFVTLVTGKTGRGYILFRYRNGFVFSYLGVDYECAFVKFENGQWYYDNNVTWQTLSQAIIDDSVIIGTIECDTPDHIKTAQIWMSPQDVTVIQYQDWEGVTGEKIPANYADVTGDQTVAGLLPNWNLDIRDSDLKPAGIRGVEGIADRSQVEFGDINENTIKILGSPDTTAGYGYPAIPIDDRSTYTITIRHRSENPPSGAGYYLQMNEKNQSLSPGKTHIGVSSGAEPIVDDRTSVVRLVNNGPTPGQAWVVNSYTYIPTTGTKFASFTMANWLGITGWVEIDYVQIAIQASAERDATVGADWFVDLDSIPARFTDSPTDGLNVTATYMGYYNGTATAWRSFIGNDGSVYFGDGGLTFGTDTFIQWDVTTQKLYVSGDVTISGTLSGVDGTFSGNLSSAGTITFTTIENTAGTIRIDGTAGKLQTSFWPDAWDEIGSIGEYYVSFDDGFLHWRKRYTAGWESIDLYPNLQNTDPALVLRGDFIPEGDGALELGRISPSRRWKNLHLAGYLSRLQVDDGGDAIREIQVANITIAANDEALAGIFVGSTNTVYVGLSIRESGFINRDAPKHRQITDGLNRLVYYVNPGGTQVTINGIMAQAGP
jgi:hypothetical protein